MLYNLYTIIFTIVISIIIIFFNILLALLFQFNHFKIICKNLYPVSTNDWKSHENALLKSCGNPEEKHCFQSSKSVCWLNYIPQV